MSVEGESSESAALGRAVGYGCISLNNAFVVRNKRFRLFRKHTLRLSLPEVIWIVLSTLIYAGILSLLVLILGLIPIIRDVTSFLLVIPAPFFGWFTGRRIARASPYRRYSGEGLGEYLWVQSDKLGPVLGKFFGRKIAMSEVTTIASGKPLTVECVEWVGTSRAAMMPKYVPSRRNSSVDVILVPSSVQTNWAQKLQARNNMRSRKEFL